MQPRPKEFIARFVARVHAMTDEEIVAMPIMLAAQLHEYLEGPPLAKCEPFDAEFEAVPSTQRSSARAGRMQ